MNKRIEVGCLCLVIEGQPQHVGKTVIVVGKSNDRGFDWTVKSADGKKLAGKGLYVPWVENEEAQALDRQLLRIDDYTEETETQEKECEV